MKARLLAIGLLAVLPGFARAASATCKTSVAPCFSIHARLSAYNGTPTFRLWPVGSHRMLGVHDDHGNTQPMLPHAVSDAIGGDAFGKEFYGDYRVCPVTAAIPGHMQMICVKSVAHLIARQTSQPR